VQKKTDRLYRHEESNFNPVFNHRTPRMTNPPKNRWNLFFLWIDTDIFCALFTLVTPIKFPVVYSSFRYFLNQCRPTRNVGYLSSGIDGTREKKRTLDTDIMHPFLCMTIGEKRKWIQFRVREATKDKKRHISLLVSAGFFGTTRQSATTG